MPRDAAHYVNQFNRAGTQTQKVRALFSEYARPRKSLSPRTWFSNRTYGGAIALVLNQTRHVKDYVVILNLISKVFDQGAKLNINRQGDFVQALIALQRCIPGIHINYDEIDQPLVSMGEQKRVERSNSLTTATTLRPSPKFQYENPDIQRAFDEVVAWLFDRALDISFSLNDYDKLLMKVAPFASEEGGFTVYDVLMFQNESGKSILHQMMRSIDRKDDLEWVKRIIRDTNEEICLLKDHEGNTPLLHAAQLKKDSVVGLIRAHSDTFYVPNSHGLLPADYYQESEAGIDRILSPRLQASESPKKSKKAHPKKRQSKDALLIQDALRMSYEHKVNEREWSINR